MRKDQAFSKIPQFINTIPPSTSKIYTEVENEKVDFQDKIGVVVIACKRPSINRCLNSILQNKEFHNERFDYYISQGCRDANTYRVIQQYLRYFGYFSFNPLSKNTTAILNQYFALSIHYRMVLKEIFDVLKYDKVILIEDDLELAEDALGYFLKLAPLLDADNSIYCISAWNDNGYQEYSHNPYTFMRTHFFPGLGWMMNSGLWEEIRDLWPNAYWDDFLRSPSIRKERSCIYPEISRVSNNGIIGVSGKKFYISFVSRVVKNIVPVRYELVDIETLKKENYDNEFFTRFNNSLHISIADLKNRKKITKFRYKLDYSSWKIFYEYSNYFKITPDSRSNIVRTSYHGITTLNFKYFYLYLYPSWLNVSETFR